MLTLGPFELVAVVAGAAWGFGADRLSARWPEHIEEPEEEPDPASRGRAKREAQRRRARETGAAGQESDGPVAAGVPSGLHAGLEPPVRGIGWRTAAVVAAGALAIGALPVRFTDPRDLAIATIWFAALTILMATDLDQRLLPDEITLALIPLALAVLLLGWNPVLAGKDLGLASGIAAAILAPAFLALTGWVFRGALGIGDLKLSVSIGLMAGISQLVAGFFVAALLYGLVLGALLAVRRLARNSLVPFGPVLVITGYLAFVRAPVW